MEGSFRCSRAGQGHRSAGLRILAVLGWPSSVFWCGPPTMQGFLGFLSRRIVGYSVCASCLLLGPWVPTTLLTSLRR